MGWLDTLLNWLLTLLEWVCWPCHLIQWLGSLNQEAAATVFVGALNAGALIAVAIIGANSFKEWRKREIAKRKMENAERVFLPAQVVISLLEKIRQRLITQEEQEHLNRVDLASTNRRAEAVVVLLRINKHIDELNSIFTAQYLSRIYYRDEEDIFSSIKNINDAIGKIRYYAKHYNTPGLRNEDELYIRSILFADSEDKDGKNQLNDEIADAKQRLENSFQKIFE